MFSPHRKQYRYGNIVMLITNLSWELYWSFVMRRGEVCLKDKNEELLLTVFAGQHAVVSA